MEKDILSTMNGVSHESVEAKNDTNDKNGNQIREIMQEVTDLIEKSAQIESGQVLYFDRFLLLRACGKLNTLEQLIISNGKDITDFKSLKHDLLMRMFYAYIHHKMWDDMFDIYKELLQENELHSCYNLCLNIGKVFISHCRFKKALKMYEKWINNFVEPDNKKLLANFLLNCGVVHILLGNQNESLTYFEKSLQNEKFIQNIYNMLLYHFIFSSNDVLEKYYCEMLQNIEKIELNDIEQEEKISMIIKASCLVASKENLYDFVYLQLKGSHYSDLVSDFEEKYSKIESKNYNENLSFFYYNEKNILKMNNYTTIDFKYNKWDACKLIKNGEKLLLNGHAKDAIEVFLNALKIDSKSFEASLDLGLAYKSIGSFDDAIKILDNLNQSWLKDDEVLFELSDCNEKMGNLDKTINYLHCSLRIHPNDSKIWNHLASIWSNLGENENALQCYIECIKNCTSYIKPFEWIKKNFFYNNKCPKVIRYIDKAIGSSQINAGLLILLGSCYEKINQKEKANETYEKAIQIDPSKKNILINLKKILNDD